MIFREILIFFLLTFITVGCRFNSASGLFKEKNFNGVWVQEDMSYKDDSAQGALRYVKRLQFYKRNSVVMYDSLNEVIYDGEYFCEVDSLNNKCFVFDMMSLYTYSILENRIEFEYIPFAHIPGDTMQILKFYKN